MQVGRRPLEKHALSLQAYEALKMRILDQDIAPGSSIGIDLVAENLGVSQTPVREALARLEGDGLVVRDARGRYHAAPLFGIPEFLHLYELRLLLEPFAAARAAERIGASEITDLSRFLKAMRSAGRRGRSVEFGAFIAADAAFHHAVALATGNHTLVDTLQNLHSNHRLGTLYRHRGVTDADKAIRDHADILDALEARDPDEARRAMTFHVQRSRDQVIDWLNASAAHETVKAEGPPGDSTRSATLEPGKKRVQHG